MTNPAPAIDIDAVSAGPELDELVAEHVMGLERVPDGTIADHWKMYADQTQWKSPSDPITEASLLIPYSTQLHYAAQVEAEISRQRLSDKYVSALVSAVTPERQCKERIPLRPVEFPPDEHRYGVGFTRSDIFALITATPEQRCRAALKAVMGE